MKDFILNQVHNGIKGTDLAHQITIEYPDVSFLQATEILEEMVSEGKIVEVRYYLTGRTRSFYLPVKTKVEVIEPCFTFYYSYKDGDSSFKGTELEWEGFASAINAELQYKELIK